jgi:hypothetical protein
MINKIRKYATEAIMLAEVPIELRRSCVKHERFNQLIQNLVIQFQKVQDLRAIQKKPPIKDNTIKSAVQDFALQFVCNVNRVAEERIASELEKQRLKDEADYAKDLNNSADGKLSGDFEELAEYVTINDNSESLKDG